MARVWLAEPQEAETVAELLVAFRDWQGNDWPSANAFHYGVERLIADPQTEYLLAAASDDDAPAGVCQLRYRYGLWLAADDCWLEDLFVADSARGAGLGSALIEASFGRARSRGCRRIELDVNRGNAEAWSLYERLGFEVKGGPGGRETLFMQRRLDDPRG